MIDSTMNSNDNMNSIAATMICVTVSAMFAGLSSAQTPKTKKNCTLLKKASFYLENYVYNKNLNLITRSLTHCLGGFY